jgi:hypothetical protein
MKLIKLIRIDALILEKHYVPDPARDDPPSVVAERLDRIEPRGPRRRIAARNQADHECKRNRAGDQSQREG